MELTDDLKWATHINKITKKANSTLGFLRRNLRNCSKDLKQTAYIALVRSLLEYSSTVWCPYLKRDISALEHVQRSAARFISNDYQSRTPGCMTQMLSELNLERLCERRSNRRLELMYRVVNGLVPALPPSLFNQAQKRRSVRQRLLPDQTQTNFLLRSVQNNSKPFKIRDSRTDQYRHSFFVDTVYQWNALEDSVVTADSIEKFKNCLRQGQHD